MVSPIFALCAAALVPLCAAKGCFVKTSRVLMADGTWKQLQQIQHGDQVASWDDSARKRVSSTVHSVPTFERPASDMIELRLESSMSTIHATEDHPFWSSSRQGLVSMHPNMSKEEYGLKVSMLGVQETLENELQKPVQVSGIHRRASTSLRFPQKKVEVSTLCLWPHHWYYVEGVRVHNKGCFVPWTPVMMKNGIQKPIGEITIDEQVLSYDMTTGKAVEAKVIGIDVFPAGQLMKITYNSSHGHKHQMKSESLVLTKDHPVYSAEQQQTVSMEPSVTRRLYGMNVGQLNAYDKLLHHSGDHVHTEVQPWNGSTPHVMTLRLDKHHWFYASGVLVHNKGGGGGGGGSSRAGGGGGGSRTVTHTRTSMGRRPFVGMIFISGGSRRRHGTYNEEPGSSCKIQSSAVMNGLCRAQIYNTQRDAFDCKVTIGGNISTNCCDCCYKCMDCETAACTDAMPGCEEFLAASFTECTEDEGGGLGTVALIIIVLICCGVIACLARFIFVLMRDDSTSNAEFINAQQARTDVRTSLVPLNRKGEMVLQLHGTYTENNETKPTSYNLTIDATGNVEGVAKDDDGEARVTGVLNWPDGTESGRIMWVEALHGKAGSEADGTLTQADSDDTSGMKRYKLEASYFSSELQAGGTTQCQSAPFAVAAAQVVTGVTVAVACEAETVPLVLPGQSAEAGVGTEPAQPETA